MANETGLLYEGRSWSRFRRDLEEVSNKLQTKGVIHFDSDDDISLEFRLRNLYLPHVAETDRGLFRFGLFLGWTFGIATARSFLDAISGEAPIAASRFVSMVTKAAGT